MALQELKKRPYIETESKLQKAYLQFEKLVAELRSRELPEDIEGFINNKIEQLNAIPEADKVLRKRLRKNQSAIIQHLEKKLKLVPVNYYRNTWLALGIGAFGIPLGAAFGASIGNMALLGIGLPFGIAIGLAIGTAMDKKALEEKRQLGLEIKY